MAGWFVLPDSCDHIEYSEAKLSENLHWVLTVYQCVKEPMGIIIVKYAINCTYVCTFPVVHYVFDTPYKF